MAVGGIEGFTVVIGHCRAALAGSAPVPEPSHAARRPRPPVLHPRPPAAPPRPPQRRRLRRRHLQRGRHARHAAAPGLRAPARDHREGRAPRQQDRRRGRPRHEGVGRRARRHALHALVPPAQRPVRRETRRVLHADGRRRADPPLLRRPADPGRARRVVLPERRHAHHVRGARLHGVGPDVARVPDPPRAGRDPLHPLGVPLVEGRGARQEDAAPALDRGALRVGLPGPEAHEAPHGPRPRDARRRAGVLPGRPAVVGRAPRPPAHRPHPPRRARREGPADGGPLLRRSSRTSTAPRTTTSSSWT